MDRYQRVEKPKPESQINENEIRITTQGAIRNYISYATTLLQEKRVREIVLKAMGQAISKTVAIAEILKKRIPMLHQDTAISSESITDVWEPIEEGLVPVEMTRHVSMISITLSPRELNRNSPGYQAPRQAEQPKPQSSYQQQQPPKQARAPYNAVNEDSYGQGRGRGRGRSRGRGRGRGRGQSWGRGGYGSYQGGYGNDQGGYGNDRGGYGNDRGGYGNDRGGYGNDRGDRGGYGNDRVGYGNDRGGYGNNRGGYGNNRGGYGNNQGGYGHYQGGYGDYQDNGGYSDRGRGGGRGRSRGYRSTGYERGRGGGRGYGRGQGRMGGRMGGRAGRGENQE